MGGPFDPPTSVRVKVGWRLEAEYGAASVHPGWGTRQGSPGLGCTRQGTPLTPTTATPARRSWVLDQVNCFLARNNASQCGDGHIACIYYLNSATVMRRQNSGSTCDPQTRHCHWNHGSFWKSANSVSRRSGTQCLAGTCWVGSPHSTRGEITARREWRVARSAVAAPPPLPRQSARGWKWEEGMHNECRGSGPHGSRDMRGSSTVFVLFIDRKSGNGIKRNKIMI